MATTTKAKVKDAMLSDLIKNIGRGKSKRPVVNKELALNLKKIINSLIKRGAQEEALEIITKSSQAQIGDFLYYYYSDSGNVACLVLDSLKDALVKSKKMKQGKKDTFGGIIY